MAVGLAGLILPGCFRLCEIVAYLHGHRRMVGLLRFHRQPFRQQVLNQQTLGHLELPGWLRLAG